MHSFSYGVKIKKKWQRFEPEPSKYWQRNAIDWATWCNELCIINYTVEKKSTNALWKWHDDVAWLGRQQQTQQLSMD